MAQTEKTTVELIALLADNTTQRVSPQDLRDAIASAMGGYASLLLTIAGAPAVKSDVQQTALIVTEYNSVEAQSVDVNTDGTSASAATGKITIGVQGIYKINFFSSFSSSAPNKNVKFQLFVNNVISNVEISRFVGTIVQDAAAGMDVLLSCGSGDVLDIRTLIDSGSADISFASLGFNCHRVG